MCLWGKHYTSQIYYQDKPVRYPNVFIASCLILKRGAIQENTLYKSCCILNISTSFSCVRNFVFVTYGKLPFRIDVAHISIHRHLIVHCFSTRFASVTRSPLPLLVLIVFCVRKTSRPVLKPPSPVTRYRFVSRPFLFREQWRHKFFASLILLLFWAVSSLSRTISRSGNLIQLCLIHFLEHRPFGPIVWLAVCLQAEQETVAL